MCLRGDSGARTVTAVEDLLATLANTLLDRVDKYGVAMADVIREQLPAYRNQRYVSLTDLRASCTANLRYVFEALAHRTPADPTVASATGTQRAQAGIPLTTVTAAYRLCFRYLWERIVSEARVMGIPPETLLEITAEVVVAHDLFTHEMTAAYNRSLTALLVRQETERSALVAALLAGTISNRTVLWEAADLLGLPISGPYVVIAAELPGTGRVGVDDISNSLARAHMHAAWRLLPDLHVAIIALPSSVPSTVSLSLLVEVLGAHAHGRVGVSPVVDDLTQVGQALELARLTIASSRPDKHIVLFEENPVGIAAVSAPAVMQRVAVNVLGPLGSLPEEERKVLLETLKVWIDAGGSTTKTADRMYCHPNTIRYRLRRIEERTGRYLNRPTDVAAVCLAMQVELSTPSRDESSVPASRRPDYPAIGTDGAQQP